MSDGEIISIEDTYRETNAACNKKSIDLSEGDSADAHGNSQQQNHNGSHSVNRGNKSMTIIEEEDYEESEILNYQANSTIS